LRRAAELVWAAADADGAGSPRQVLGLGIDLARRRGAEPASGWAVLPPAPDSPSGLDPMERLRAVGEASAAP
jgi:hypothetical protein